MDTDEQLKRLQDLMERQEELDPELEPYYEEEGPMGFSSIRHPLVYSILHSPNQNAMANAQLKAKQEALSSAFLEKRWSSYIYLHERPYRINAFMAIWDLLTDEQYWNLLGDIWTDSENIWQNEQDWRLALTSDRPGRHLMMSEDERGELSECFDPLITVYRGFTVPGRERGLSWTTNSIVAKFFARRFAGPGDTPYLAEGMVAKEDVLAYFTGRSEYEVVALPETIEAVKIVEVPGV